MASEKISLVVSMNRIENSSNLLMQKQFLLICNILKLIDNIKASLTPYILNNFCQIADNLLTKSKKISSHLDDELNGIKAREKLKQLATCLPAFQPYIVFFPSNWKVKGEKSNEAVFSHWNYSQSPTITLIKNDINITLEVTCDNNQSIHLLLDSQFTLSQAKDHALLIHSIVSSYPPAIKHVTIMVNSNIKDYEKLICYIQACQKIIEGISNQQSNDNIQKPPLISIKRQDSNEPFLVDESKVNEAVNEIINGDRNWQEFIKHDTSSSIRRTIL